MTWKLSTTLISTIVLFNTMITIFMFFLQLIGWKQFTFEHLVLYALGDCVAMLMLLCWGQKDGTLEVLMKKNVLSEIIDLTEEEIRE